MFNSLYVYICTSVHVCTRNLHIYYYTLSPPPLPFVHDEYWYNLVACERLKGVFYRPQTANDGSYDTFVTIMNDTFVT